MRFPMLIACVVGALAGGVVGAAHAMHAPVHPVRVRAIRASVDHYRSVAWLFQRAARQRPTPTSFSYRRSTDPAYLQWTLKQWQEREYDARLHAIDALQHRLDVPLPHGPALHASLTKRIAYARTLTVRLQRIYPGRVTAARTLATA